MAATPSPPIESSTVLLLRSSQPGMQVFMVVRHEQIDFASGALVFPGGKVDAADGDPALAPFVTGANAFDRSERAFRVAAIREAFEECGVLLARERGAQRTVPPSRLKSLEGYRQPLARGETTMLELARREDLELAADLLVPYSHWVTPAFVPKRFDTWFFLAHAPEDQLAVHDGEESIDSEWVAPAQALADFEAKRRVLLFPTRLNLMMLGETPTPDEAIAAARARTIRTVEPWIAERDGRKWLTIRDDAGYALTEVPIDPGRARG